MGYTKQQVMAKNAWSYNANPTYIFNIFYISAEGQKCEASRENSC
jgi:hypothetical protein